MLPRAALRLTQVMSLLILVLATCSLILRYVNAGTVTVPSASSTLAEAGTPSKFGVIPSRIRIPSLEIDAPVIPVGVSRSGQMEVPAGADTVGWYAPGTRPGNTGSAVLSGHLDTVIGTHGVFWNLRKLTAGDEVFLDSASGRTLRFRVTDTRTYPVEKAPVRDIFSASGGQLLNLITCSGTWTWPTYDQRLVVFTQLADSDKAK